MTESQNFFSERLAYTKITENDFDLFYSLYSSPQVMEYTLDEICESRDIARSRFDDLLKGEKILYVSTRKIDSIRIGLVGYTISENNSNHIIPDIGYSIFPEYWNQGYATEMGKSIIDQIFSTTNAHKITAICSIANIASAHILQKLGMKLEGTSRKARYKNNSWIDELQFGMLKEDHT